MDERLSRNGAPYLADGDPDGFAGWGDGRRRADGEPYGGSWDRRRTAVRPPASGVGPEGAWSPLGAEPQEALSPRNLGTAARNETLAPRNDPLSVRNGPLSTRNEPLSVRNEPFSARNEPLSVRNDPALAQNLTMPLTADPASPPADPLTRPGELGGRPADPRSRPARPAGGSAAAAPRYSRDARERERAARAAAPPRSARPGARSGRAGREDAPGKKIAGNRLLVILLFWALLATSAGLWVFATPAVTLTTPAEIITGVGRITGLVGGYLLMVQVLMMSRVSWLETWVGGHDLTRWHRRLGAWTLVLVLAHVGYTVVGYALTDQVAIAEQTVTLITTYEDMLGATAAVGIMVAISVLAARALRRRLPYELWHWLHLSAYAALILGYGHQFATGSELSQDGFARWFWTGLYALVIACLFWGRLVEPLWLNLRHRLHVVDVVPESDTVVSIYVGGHALDRLGARAGQYFRWRFLTAGGWWQSHPFSLSAAPNQQWLRLTVNAVGGYTAGLRRMRPGTRVIVQGPSGTFTAEHRTRRRALLIAGGSGIAPVRALLEELPGDTVVIYRASGPDDIVFADELRGLAQRRSFQLRYVLGSRHEPEPRRLFTPEGLRELVPDVRHRDVYLCGPPGMVESAIAVLRRLRVRRRQIHLDPFEF
ncbi:ferredoxin reductase family protein [Actinomadura keratinilytica]|uniref:FAD-binding FR-type domain-containing protein n=1 Tax=Actinomadura keratinilytica TaxID=547461 RepID=A0ABP7Z7E0_9ACTN